PRNSAARGDVPMGPCRYTFRRTAATRRYHQSFWTGAFSVFTPVRANGAHSGGLILPSAWSFSLSRSIKRTGGTSYAVVIRNTRRFALHKSKSYLKACVLSRRAQSSCTPRRFPGGGSARSTLPPLKE